MYQFSPLNGDFFYAVGANIVVYDPVHKVQKEYLRNTKGLPFSSVAFSPEGNDLYAGEYMAKEANIKHYSVSKSGRLVAKNSMKTSFRAIDGMSVSYGKTMLAVYGTVRNSENKDLKKLEIFDLNTKQSLGVQGVSYKIKQFFFTKDDSIYLLCKDGVYDASIRQKWRPRLRQSFAGKGRIAMDMVDHDDKILVILDNSNLVVLDKDSGMQDTIELPLKDVTPI